jgi:hypothetical protein
MDAVSRPGLANGTPSARSYEAAQYAQTGSFGKENPAVGRVGR